MSGLQTIRESIGFWRRWRSCEALGCGSREGKRKEEKPSKGGVAIESVCFAEEEHPILVGCGARVVELDERVPNVEVRSLELQQEIKRLR